MIHSKTVFVVGAGASKEVGLPIGSELARNIAHKLRTKTSDFHGTTLDDGQLQEALRAVSIRGTQIRPAEAGAIGKLISDAMPLALSIDNFLHSHEGNEKLTLIGKTAIVASILNAEKESFLYVDRSNSLNRIRFSKLQGTWFQSLWHLLSTDLQKNSIGSIFQNVSFIVFNYDRCIEQFLFEALKSYYDIDDSDACQIMEKLTIIHPYGTVGKLPQLNNGSGLNFGHVSDSRRFVSQTAGIRTFTEQLAAGVELDNIHDEINGARKLIFLGFAYHNINMKLLTSKAPKVVDSVFGTRLGISEPDADIVKERIFRMLATDRPIETPAPIALADCACVELFERYNLIIGA